jgi:hypothetical protein
MITHSEYLKAMGIVEQFLHEEKERLLIAKREAENRYASCPEHYYLPSGEPYSPQGQKTCQFCGHKIG